MDMQIMRIERNKTADFLLKFELIRGIQSS